MSTQPTPLTARERTLGGWLARGLWLLNAAVLVMLTAWVMAARESI